MRGPTPRVLPPGVRLRDEGVADSLCRKRSFATDGRGRRPTSAAVQYAHITADYKKLAALLAQE